MSLGNSSKPISAADAPAAFAVLAEAIEVGPYTPALEGCRDVFRQAVRDNFTSSATPDDVDWNPRKIAGDGHPLLMDTGALLQAATGGGAGAITEIGSHEMTLGVSGSTIVYAATHNYGRPEANIPQREFFGMNEEAIDECENLLADFVLEAIIGG